ncbi:MAG: glyoxylase-like metal-dependent hydrolase (beta-lactamase superfamily II) [Thermoproteota archaeon]|jgi:glyoxylase-like metal-dependent hydrolase (beta-lactamase superfamily II)
MSQKIEIEEFFHKDTSTFTYLVYDPDTKDAIVIDSVLDFNSAQLEVSLISILKVHERITDLNLSLNYILDTHIHADHLSGGHELKKLHPKAKTAINSRVVEVQSCFKDLLDLEDFTPNSGQFDILLGHEQVISAGSFEIKTYHTPGHTPSCSCFHIGNYLFSGDSIFMPDFGTGRCDFPNGSAKSMYHSIKEIIYSLSDDTKIYVGHDYCPGGRELKFITSVLEQKEKNVQLTNQTSQAEYVDFRTNRDKQLNKPRLLYQAIQVNINGGKLPTSNGKIFFKLPVEIIK